MTVRKISSTNNANREGALTQCPVTYTLEKIGGRWKPIILWQLTDRKLRYSELRRMIPEITEKMLIQHLKQLESDQLVIRKAKATVPPHVEYRLSKLGKEIVPVMNAMAVWGLKNRKR